jgi:hypothetical protein
MISSLLIETKLTFVSSKLFLEKYNSYKGRMNLVFIKSYICPINAQLNCFKMLKFTLRFTINAPTCLGLTKPSSGSLQSVLRQSCNIDVS